MFLVMGIYDRSKEIPYSADVAVCPSCGRYCSYKVFVTYMCFSLFFIPLIKWGKRYFATSSCCQKNYELNYEKGKRAENGEKIVITEDDLYITREL